MSHRSEPMTPAEEQGRAGAAMPEKRLRPPRLRAHLICLMLLFLGLMLLVTWLFQVVLLDVVYENVRKRDLERAAGELAESLGGEELPKTVFDISMNSLAGVLVYRIDGEYATEIATETPTVGSGRFEFTPERIQALYAKALQNEGEYHTKVTFGGHEVEHSFFQGLFPPGKAETESAVAAKMVNLIYIRLVDDEVGNQYMMLLNTELAPMEPTVHTLQTQFVWVFCILLGLVVLFTIPLSNWISRPIAKMNEAARQLASGNYEADFSHEVGYLETEELAQTLQYASQELSRTDKLQKELIANISHDLRTPLTMIRGYAEAMRDIPGENSPENLQILIDETEHLSELVKDLLDLSKIRSGVQCPVMEFFDLSAAVGDVLERYEAFTKAQGYNIRTELTATAPVFADRSMILQVIYNLINNALNYTGADRTVSVSLAVQGGAVRFAVKDSGEGIPEEQLPLIWDRYYKVKEMHRIAPMGTGLGLSIVKGILQVHNAAYGVESRIGEGSVFWFELPVSAPPEQG